MHLERSHYPQRPARGRARRRYRSLHRVPTVAISSSNARAPATRAPNTYTRARSPGVGGVDERCRRIGNRSDQLHNSVVRAIPAPMPGMDHGKALVRRHHAGRLRTIEYDRPCATVAARHRADLGDEPLRGLGAVAPPAVRTGPHHVVSVNEHHWLHRLDHAGRRVNEGHRLRHSHPGDDRDIS